MSKKENLLKGFNNLIKATDTNVETLKPEVINENEIKRLSAITSKLLDAQTATIKNHREEINVAKYKEFRKCTLYLPPEIMDSLAIMKIKTKKDLSELTAEALKEYLIVNKFINA